jgi:cell division protein FtsW
MDFINKIFRGDRVIWMIFMFLCLISIVEVYSATSTLTYRQNYWDPIVQHTMYLLLGLVFVLGFHAVPPKYFSLLAICLPLVWVLLLATKFIGQTVNGADRWLSLGPVSFQPSEAAKLCLIAATAFLLARRNSSNTEDKTFKWIMIAAGITCGIIIIDNFSTAGLLFGIVFLMMFIGQIPLKKLGKIILIFVVGLTIMVASIAFLPTGALNTVFHRGVTWKERIKDFNSDKNESKDPSTFEITDDNYQVSHAKIAVAEGRIIGKMPGNSQERDFLPQAYSDFIYAIIIEELGLAGGIGVLLLYVILLIRTGIIANRCDKLFPKYLTLGCGLIIVSQAMINMGVAVGLIPVTGQPLPLISRGGTSTIITCIYFGIILSVSRFNNPKGVEREETIALEAEQEAQAAHEAEERRKKENNEDDDFDPIYA